jgi:transposase
MRKSDSTEVNGTEPNLPETVIECHDLIRQLQVSHIQVMQRLSELEERLKLNSRNSSKPPSSDGPGTPPRTSRPKSGKRLGGQPGHKGSFRAMVPTEQTQAQVICPAPDECPACGASVQADPDKPIRHQVFELPRIEPLITEYVRLRGVCSGCGRKHHGALPAGVPTGQLGARALALVGTLAGQFHLTQRKVQAVLSHIMGIRFSLGTVSQAHGLVAQGLAKPVAQLHTQLQHAPVCHADETRHQSHGQTLWTWALVSDWGAKFTIDPSRGQIAAKQVLGAAPNFNLVSDRYAGYNYVPIEQRQVCWAHLLRDFERIAGRSGLAGRIGKRLLAYGYLLFRWRGRGKGERHYRWLQGRIRLQLEQATQQTRCSRTANTCANLLKMWPALWTFVHNPLVPPTNNAAEQALRGWVIKRKLSFFTRSGRGMRFWETMMSTVQTCSMQGKSTFDYVGEVMQAWMAGRSPPSLVPEHVHLHPAACS